MTLNKIYWSFDDVHYKTVKEFNKAVSEYQIKLKETDEDWKPLEILIEVPKVQIMYMAWIEKPEDLLENERLIPQDANIFEEETDEDEHQVEIIAVFDANNGKSFSAGEFLMKTHNTQINKELGDHIFFEGIDIEPSEIDSIPTYYIACGS